MKVREVAFIERIQHRARRGVQARRLGRPYKAQDKPGEQGPFAAPAAAFNVQHNSSPSQLPQNISSHSTEGLQQVVQAAMVAKVDSSYSRI